MRSNVSPARLLRWIPRLLLIAAVFLGGFAYFRLEFGRFAEKRSALSAKMDAHGPWAEQGVWAADDGSA